MTALTTEERRTLLEQLSQLVIPPRERYRPRPSSPVELLSPAATFVPTMPHRQALLPHCTLILGRCGTGKSTLFRMLLDKQKTSTLKPVLELSGREDFAEAEAFEAFCDGPPHAPLLLLDQPAGREPRALEAMWTAHLIRRLAEFDPALVPHNDDTAWLTGPDWLDRAPDHARQMRLLLHEVEDRLTQQKRMLYACYDDLDRFQDWQPLCAALASMWRSLLANRRQVRAKIFLRTDQYNRLAAASEDVQTLRGVTLRWMHSDLFRVLVRHMTAAGEAVCEYLQRVPELGLHHSDDLGLMPGPMQEEAQKALAHLLVGEMIGTTALGGLMRRYTYRMLRSSVEDARRDLAPRLLVPLIGGAAQAALKDPQAQGPHLLTEKDLYAGLSQAGRYRVHELASDYPVVRRLKNLALQELPMRGEVIARLLGGGDSLQQLLELGLVHSYHLRGGDVVYDLPDLFLYAYRSKRIAKEGEGDIPGEQEPGRLRAEAEAVYDQALRYKEESRRAAREGRVPDWTEFVKLLKEAGGKLKEALERQPNDLQACMLLANVVRRQSWLVPAAETCRLCQEAADILKRAESEGAPPEALYTRLGWLYHRWAEADPEDYAELLRRAEEQFEKAWKQDQDSVLANLDLGWVRARRAACEPAQAQELLNQAQVRADKAWDLAQDPRMERRTWGWARDLQAAIDAAQGRYEEAAKKWAEATKDAPDEARIYMRWGQMLLWKQGLLPEAREKLDQARHYEPDRIATRAALCYLAIREAVQHGEPPPAATVDTLENDLAPRAPGLASYPLACAYGALGDAKRCGDQLDLARRMGELPPADRVRDEPCLAPVRGAISL